MERCDQSLTISVVYAELTLTWHLGTDDPADVRSVRPVIVHPDRRSNTSRNAPGISGHATVRRLPRHR